jgi:hypothetical protein
MISILGQGLLDGVAGGAVGIALTVAALLIKQGVCLKIGNHRETGPEKEARFVSRIECRTIHDAIDRLERERHETVVAGINEVKSGIGNLHERINEVVKDQRKS